MKATQRYELIRSILQKEKTVTEIHQETSVPLSTIYYYMRRFRESNGELESLALKSRAPRSNPHWFTSLYVIPLYHAVRSTISKGKPYYSRIGKIRLLSL